MNGVSTYRLIYLKIDKYKNIKDRDVRFTLDYEIHEDKIGKKLNIVKSKFSHLKDKRHNSLGHLDVFTALVGENGSGKSNLIELISYIYTTGMFPEGLVGQSSNSYAVVEQNVNGNISFYLITPNISYYNKEFSKSTGVAFCTKLEEYNEFGKTILYHPLNDLSAGTTSNVVFNTEKIASNPFKKLSIGIADSKLAKQFAENSSKLSEFQDFQHISNNKYSRLVLLFSDFKAAIEEDVLLQNQFSIFSTKTAQVKLYNAFLEMLKNDVHPLSSFILVYAFFITFSAVQNNKRYSDVPYLDALMVSFSLLVEEVEFIKPFQKELNKYIQKQGLETFREEVGNHVNEFREDLKLFSVEYNELNGSHLSVKLTEVEENKVLDLICSKDWFDFPNQPRAFQGAGIPLKIDGLSSGEISAIHYLSELHSKIEKYGSSAIIILDEPENSFHPEWQRILISIMDELYSKLNVAPQTIISSHSPFILSDMLPGKVLFLGDKKGLDNCFAANIHDLLSDGFFLNQTIGNASKKEVTKIIDLINTPLEELSDDNEIAMKIELARDVIKHVGDNVLQRELSRKLNKFELALSPIGEELISLLSTSKQNSELKGEIRELARRYSLGVNSNV